MTYFTHPVPHTVEGIAFVDNLMQMREDQEWKQVWAIMLSHACLNDEDLAKLDTEQRQYEAYMVWLEQLNQVIDDACAIQEPSI
jgi:hypothetical protein